MPDRRDPYASMADLDDAGNPHMSGAAIANCGMCDGDGYRPNLTVCDHVDRGETTRAGMAAVRAALAKGKP